jgi:hypothetical protein
MTKIIFFLSMTLLQLGKVLKKDWPVYRMKVAEAKNVEQKLLVTILTVTDENSRIR